MLMARVFQPSADQILYHYCGAESFQAILETGRLRFTDINMLNDSLEHRWGYSIFEEAATRLITRKGVPDTLPVIPKSFFDAIDTVLSSSQVIAHPFVSCLSLDANSLDQWRKYADDGRGYAIGFRAADLSGLPISLLAVCYDIEEQVREMMGALLAMYQRTPEPLLPLKGDVFDDALLIAVYMSALKHPSFASEREIRCVRAISVERVGANKRFVDRGGHSSDNNVIPGEPVKFATRCGALTAYVDLPYTLPAKPSSIAEVALGPKNTTGPGNAFLFLGSLGHSDIKVRSSNLPYR